MRSVPLSGIKHLCAARSSKRPSAIMHMQARARMSATTLDVFCSLAGTGPHAKWRRLWAWS
eukprot:644611-Alexandrium_andersonii.AAC.1